MSKSGSKTQKCTSKGMRRHGVVSKHKNSLQKGPTPCRHTPSLVQPWKGRKQEQEQERSAVIIITILLLLLLIIIIIITITII